MEALCEWLARHNAIVGALCAAEFGDTGRGLLATADITAGDQLVLIPEAVFMSTHSAYLSEIGPLVKKYNARCAHSSVTLKPIHVLALHLIHELLKGEKSFWHHYINVLPRHFTTPLYWQGASSSDLHDVLLTERAVAQRQLVDRLFDVFKQFLEVHPAEFPTSEYTYERFQWAWSIVQTRACYMEIDKATDDTSVLLPFSDCFNHSSSVVTEARYQKELKGYQFVTQTPFSKGSQVLIRYGGCDNSTLLLQYGFALLNNPMESVHIDDIATTFAHPPATLAGDLAVLQNFGITQHQALHFQPLDWSLVMCLRVLLMTKEERKHISVQTVVISDSPVSDDNEMKVFRHIIGVCRKRLSAFPTSIKQDMEIIEDPHAAFVKKHMVIYRCTQKQVLAHNILCAEKHLESLSVSTPDTQPVVTAAKNKTNAKKRKKK